MKKRRFTAILFLSALLRACGTLPEAPNNTSGVEAQMTYSMISQTEAKQIMDERKDIILLDVRTFGEYNEGHIPGAICVPNEVIKEALAELPDKNQTILVYCRSGRRSKEAAGKLAALGYTDIREFGGIIDWQYEITKDSHGK